MGEEEGRWAGFGLPELLVLSTQCDTTRCDRAGKAGLSRWVSGR